MNQQADFIGLTWDHPRGYDALAEAARIVNCNESVPLIHWKKQPLEGFESAPIAELAAEHDLLVLDHPHLGEAIATDCLIPLDSLYSDEQIQTWSAACIGDSFKSYQMNGKSWALPLDVATQVVARRPDRIPEAPSDWKTVESIAQHQPVALSLAGPHALLTMLSIAASSGHRPQADEFLPAAVMEESLSLMQRLYARRPIGSERLNPIALLESMAEDESIALVPLVFGYVTYSIPGTRRHPIAFSDTFGLSGANAQSGESAKSGPVLGGVLGGTGIGFTKRSTPSKALLDHIADLLLDDYQQNLIPQHGGQPSFRSAWNNRGVNDATGNFYRDTGATAERALLRPRFDGYIKFQTAISARIRQALEAKESVQHTSHVIQDGWRKSTSPDIS